MHKLGYLNKAPVKKNTLFAGSKLKISIHIKLMYKFVKNEIDRENMMHKLNYTSFNIVIDRTIVWRNVTNNILSDIL